MAHIPYVPYEDADGFLAELYARYGRDDGVDNIIRVHSLNPRSMEGHLRYYAHIVRGPSPLSRAQREMIAVVVSAANDCYYCTNHHGASLRELTDDAGLPRELALDYTRADLTGADRAMLDFAVKLTRTPGEMAREEVEALEDAGFEVGAILDICQVAAYFNFVNRLANGLGVELEDRWSADERVLTREEFEARR